MPANLANDIIVVGAGVVGLAAACGLQQLGYQVVVIERDAAVLEPEGDLQARVSALSPASIDFMADIGLGLPQHERVRQYENMRVWTDGLFDQVHFSAAELAKPLLGVIAENGLVQYQLLQRAIALGISVKTGTQWQQLQQDQSSVELLLESGETLKADYLLVAEGAQSALREQLAINREGWSYSQRAIVCSVQWQQAPDNQLLAINNTAWQRFLASGPLALLPLANGDSSLVWSLDDEAFAQRNESNDVEFVAALNAELAGVLPSAVLSVGKRFSFPLQLAQSTSYRQGRCFLLGDAAHSVHPLAGQGLNLGIMDARDLVAAFAAGASEIKFAAWQRKRRAKAQQMMLLTDALFRLYRRTSANPSNANLAAAMAPNILRSLLSAGMASVGGLTLLRQQLARLAVAAD